MKIIYNKILPPKGFTAINLFGVILARQECEPLDRYILNHESIHSEQIKELLFIPFYLLYVVEWIVRLIQYRDAKEAYFNISFEREAYQNHANLQYLESRKRFSFRKYISYKLSKDS